MSETEKKQYFERKPIHEFKAQLSQDGKFWIFRDIKTWIISIGYLDSILASKTIKSADSEIVSKTTSKAKKNDRTT